MRNQVRTRPRIPRPWNSSILAGKASRRLIMAGSRNVSPAEMWLLTRIAGPDFGMLSAPLIEGLKSNRHKGANATHLKTQ